MKIAHQLFDRGPSVLTKKDAKIAVDKQGTAGAANPATKKVRITVDTVSSLIFNGREAKDDEEKHFTISVAIAEQKAQTEEASTSIARRTSCEERCATSKRCKTFCRLHCVRLTQAPETRR